MIEKRICDILIMNGHGAELNYKNDDSDVWAIFVYENDPKCESDDYGMVDGDTTMRELKRWVK